MLGGSALKRVTTALSNNLPSLIGGLYFGEGMTLQSVETIPKSGEFLLAVWEGDWDNPRRVLRYYHAAGYHDGPSWANRSNYRTAEGEAYIIAGWCPLPNFQHPENIK